MASSPRVVAELGRPETADETAARKAESSRVYRSSQTARNLVAALLATLAVMVVVVLGVPRGDLAPTEPIDVAAVAARVQDSLGTTIVTPVVPADWSVNGAAVGGDGQDVWTIVYALPDDGAYVRVAQAFDADDTFAAQTLRGAAPAGTVTIDGVAWERYDIADPSAAGNVSRALGVQAGADHVLVYGTGSADDLELVARSVAGQIRELQTEAR